MIYKLGSGCLKNIVLMSRVLLFYFFWGVDLYCKIMLNDFLYILVYWVFDFFDKEIFKFRFKNVFRWFWILIK